MNSKCNNYNNINNSKKNSKVNTDGGNIIFVYFVPAFCLFYVGVVDVFVCLFLMG